MITVEKITRGNDRYCSACRIHRKPNANTIAIYKITLRTSSDANGYIHTLCEDCLKELQEKVQDAN